MIEQEILREKLATLRQEHQDLDDVIDQFQRAIPVDFVQVQRLKKRKLLLKDMIMKLESDCVPDIIA